MYRRNKLSAGTEKKKKILSNFSQIPEYQTQDHQNAKLSTMTFGTCITVASELNVKLSKHLCTIIVDKWSSLETRSHIRLRARTHDSHVRRPSQHLAA